MTPAFKGKLGLHAWQVHHAVTAHINNQHTNVDSTILLPLPDQRHRDATSEPPRSITGYDYVFFLYQEPTW